MAEQQSDEIVIEEASEEELPSKEEVQPKAGPSREEELDRELTGLKNEVQEQGLLARLMADPDFRSVIEMKNQGKKVKIIDSSKEAEEEKPMNLEDLNPTQLTEHIVKKASQSVFSQLDEKLAPLMNKLQGLEGHVNENASEKAEKKVAEAREEFEDFDAYSKDMIALNKKHNGTLEPVELYLLAKRKRGGNLTREEARSTASERTSDTSVSDQPRKSKMEPGRAGFSKALDNVLGRIRFPKGFNELEE